MVGYVATGLEHGDDNCNLPHGISNTNSQNRDAAAIQAKLDELIRAVHDARNEFVGIEHLTDDEIEAIRAALEQEVATQTPGRRRHETIDRMLDRR